MNKKLSDKMTFGKHSGKTIEWIIENDPDYFNWLLDNSQWFSIDAKAEARLDARSAEIV